MSHSQYTGIRGIFSQARQLFTTHYKDLLMTSAWLLGIGYLLLSLIPMQLIATPLQGGMYSYAFAVDGSLELMTLHGFLQFALAILGIMTTAAIFIQTRSLIDHNRIVHWKHAIKEARTLLFGLLGTTLMQVLFLFGLFLLLVIPGIIFMVYWVFSVYVVVHYGKKWRAALDESKKIVRGRWWKTLGYMFVLYLPMILITALLQWGLQFTYGLWGWAFLPDLLHNGAMMVIQCFYAVIASVFFLQRDRSRLVTETHVHHHTDTPTHHHA